MVSHNGADSTGNPRGAARRGGGARYLRRSLRQLTPSLLRILAALLPALSSLPLSLVFPAMPLAAPTPAQAAAPSDGVLAWGAGANGRLGANATPNTQSTPVQVVGPSNVGMLNGVTAIAAGNFGTHNLALRAPEPPVKLVVCAPDPASPTVNQSFSITVTATDAGDTAQIVTADSTVTLTKKSGHGQLSGTLTKAMTAGTSSVTFTSLTLRRGRERGCGHGERQRPGVGGQRQLHGASGRVRVVRRHRRGQ
ncbi:MAG: RCC1 domain-containing protein [Chloroflexi bacterium]|nr:RCC1 domain-containing protein [Chloroflexota bacterium]